MKSIKKIVLGVVLASTLSTSVSAIGIFADRSEIKQEDLAGITTIAPITVMYTVRGIPSEKGGFNSNELTRGKKMIRKPLTDKQKEFYNSFTAEMLATFESKTGKKIVTMKEETLMDLPQKDYEGHLKGLVKEPDKTVIMMEPYLCFDRDDSATLAEAVKRLNVDAVALFLFKTVERRESGMLGISNKEKYSLKCDIFIIGKDGKVIVSRDVDSKPILAGKVVGYAGMGSNKVNENFYDELRVSWFESFNKIFK